MKGPEENIDYWLSTIAKAYYGERKAKLSLPEDLHHLKPFGTVYNLYVLASRGFISFWLARTRIMI